MQLNRTTQCKNCPWKVGADVNKIPNYSRKQHEDLIGTIATEQDNHLLQRPIMACHCSKDESPEHCVGYLHNQLNQGNNIGLRLRAMKWDNAGDIKVVGQQHETFEDTLK